MGDRVIAEFNRWPDHPIKNITYFSFFHAISHDRHSLQRIWNIFDARAVSSRSCAGWIFDVNGFVAAVQEPQSRIGQAQVRC